MILEALGAARCQRLPDGRLLRQLTEALGAKRVVELGTSTGESGIWFALALRKTGGHLYTHDIDKGRIAIARENFKKAGVDQFITIIEGDGHETVKQHREPIDVRFIDADKEGYADYLEERLVRQRTHRTQHAPASDYLKAITTNPALDTSFVLMDGAGSNERRATLMFPRPGSTLRRPRAWASGTR